MKFDRPPYTCLRTRCDTVVYTKLMHVCVPFPNGLPRESLFALPGCVDAVGENESLKLAVSNNPIFLTVTPRNSLKKDKCFHKLSHLSFHFYTRLQKR